MSKGTSTPKVPKLRFPEFSGEWEASKLAQFVDPRRKITYGIVQPGEFVEEGVPLVRGGDYSNGWVDFKEVKRVTAEIDRPYQRSKLKGGDLLLTIVGANTGNVAVVPHWLEGANITQTTARIAVEDRQVSGFIEQYFNARSGKREVYRYLKGAAQPGLNLSDVEKFRVLHPIFAEQEKISAFIGTLNERIRLLNRHQNALRTYKKVMMQRIFSQKIRLRRVDGAHFPAWEEKRLGDLFDRVTRKNAENNLNVMTISAQQGLISQQEFFNKSVAASDVTGYYLLRRNDFAYNKSYSSGYPMGAIKRLKRYAKGVVSTLYICFSAKRAEDTEFFEHFFDDGGLNRELHRIAQEGARNHGLLNMSVVEFFRDIRISSPHPEEKDKIANFLSALDKKIDAVSAQLAATQSFKRGLLQKMFV
jgi:type I restriction enzyme, S subunit